MLQFIFVSSPNLSIGVGVQGFWQQNTVYTCTLLVVHNLIVMID